MTVETTEIVEKIVEETENTEIENTVESEEV